MLKRLDRPETWLKALVAIILVLLGLCAGYLTWAHIRSVREAALTTATAEIDLLASLAALEYGRVGPAEPRPAQLQRVLRAIPAATLGQGRTILLADSQAKVVAGSSSTAAATLADLFGEGQPLTFFADRAGVMSVHLDDGSEVLATIRGVSDGFVVVFQPLAAALSETRTRFVGEFSVLAALLLAAGSLGAVCTRQMRWARETGDDRERVRRRLNTSLSRGRCGLWDWDLARGRLVW